MFFDLNKIEKFVSNTKEIALTEEEIAFMSNIFNSIINSEDYEITSSYLAGIYGMSVSDIKFIRNVYYRYFASKEEKRIYTDKISGIKKEKRRKGFIDLTIAVPITFLIGIIGITLACLLYYL